jgi:hypothetical protein
MSTHCARLRVCGKELATREATCDAPGHVPEPSIEIVYADDLAETVRRFLDTGMDLTGVRLALANYKAVRR